jgi:hypothetical protein
MNNEIDESLEGAASVPPAVGLIYEKCIALLNEKNLHPSCLEVPISHENLAEMIVDNRFMRPGATLTRLAGVRPLLIFQLLPRITFILMDEEELKSYKTKPLFRKATPGDQPVTYTHIAKSQSFPPSKSKE